MSGLLITTGLTLWIIFWIASKLIKQDLIKNITQLISYIGLVLLAIGIFFVL